MIDLTVHISYIFISISVPTSRGLEMCQSEVNSPLSFRPSQQNLLRLDSSTVLHARQRKPRLTLRRIDMVKPNIDSLIDLTDADFLGDLPSPKPNLRDLPTVIEKNHGERHCNGRFALSVRGKKRNCCRSLSSEFVDSVKKDPS